MEYTIYFTAEDGSTAKITGPQAAIDAVERAFKRAGLWFNTSVETWDEEAFYHHLLGQGAQSRSKPSSD